MARKVFYSFHFERDAWRAGQVRNCDVVANEDEYGVIDGVEWEKIERQGEEAVKRWINEQLKNTSVTVVLIGAETSERKWVKYEIKKSLERGNGFVGLRIHSIKTQDQQTDSTGKNPLDDVMTNDGKLLSTIYKTYDWEIDNGRKNLGLWVEEAFQNGKLKDEIRLDNTSIPIARPTLASSQPTIIQNPPKPWVTN